MLLPAAPRGERLLRQLARAWLGAVAVFALAVSALAIRDHLRVPFVDDWRVLDHYQSRELLPYLFAAENGHRLPLTLALFAIDQEWLGGRMEGLAAAAVACTALAAALLHRAFRRDGALSDPIGRIALGFAVFALFWAAGCHDLLWGLNQGSLQAVALVVLALGSLARVDPARVRGSLRWLGLAVLAALLATLSQSVGAASWAALVAAAAVRRLPFRVVAGLAALGALVVALFAASLPPHPRISFADSLRFAAGDPFALIELALAFLGSAPARVAVALGLGAPMPQAPSRGAWSEHTRDLYRMAVVLGGVALALFAVLAARARRPAARPALDALCVGLMVFSIGGAFLVAFARAAIVGPAAAVQLRFVTWSTLFWIGAACALAAHGGSQAARPARLARRAAPAARLRRRAPRAPGRPPLPRHLGQPGREPRHRAPPRAAPRRARAQRLAARGGARPSRRRAARGAGALALRRGAPGPARRRAARALRGRGRLSRRAGAGERPAPARVRGGEGMGMALGRAIRGRARPRFVVLTDEAGVIRGLADFAAAPPALRAAGTGPERIAWAGFIADHDPSQRYSAWAIGADGSTACRLGPA